MRTGEQTSRHLLLAVITTVFTTVLGLMTLALAWELWMLPLMAAGCLSVWFLHITKFGTDAFYEHLCAGSLLLEFFFFSVHRSSLFDIPAVACVLLLALFMLNKKPLIRVLEAVYVLALLYHALVLRTISPQTGFQDWLRLGLGAAVTFGGAALACYWIRQRSIQHSWYDRVFRELETAGK